MSSRMDGFEARLAAVEKAIADQDARLAAAEAPKDKPAPQRGRSVDKAPSE